MCLWAKGPPRGVPPGLAEVGEILIGLSPVILPFAHQTKWKKKERFFFKAFLLSSQIFPHVGNLVSLFVAEILFLRAFGTETFTQ